MYKFVKKFHFAAYVAPDHRPQEMIFAEKTQYQVDLVFRSAMLTPQFTLLYMDQLELFQNHLTTMFEGQFVNTFIPYPTPEALAQHFYDWAMHVWPDLLYTVRVSNDPNMWAEYFKDSLIYD